MIDFHDPETQDNGICDLATGDVLRSALDRNQMVLCYQPRIDVATHRLIGVEALVRWQNPFYGLVPHNEFIALAEQTGLIRQLTRWVLGQSVRQLVAWSQDGLDIGLSMTLSPRNLCEDDLVATLSRLLRENPVAPARLTLEISERAIILEHGRSPDVLRQLGKTGVRLSIGDFGIGHSSRACLEDLPVDELKIDKSFIDKLNGDDNDAAIVRSMIELAHDLGLNVVAGGVSGESQLRALEALGCDVAQGLYIARPLPEREFAEWLYTHTLPMPGSAMQATGRYLPPGVDLVTARAS